MSTVYSEMKQRYANMTVEQLQKELARVIDELDKREVHGE